MEGASPNRRRLAPAEPLVRAIESARVLDRPAKLIGRKVRGALSPGAIKDAISGSWLGHPVHPLLTDVVVGSFMSATLLDLIGGDDAERSSERLIAIGIAASGPTAVTGVNDWADAEPADDAVRRAGIVHAVTNVGALCLYALSLVARRRHDRQRGAVLGGAGAALLAGGAYLGGHLSYAKGVGVEQTVFDEGPIDWLPAIEASHLPERDPTRAVVAETPVLLVRDGDRMHAIHDRCSHRGCSLSRGELVGEEIVCACHGSRYALSDGALKRGPATGPQPSFEVRERNGQIEVRRRAPHPG